ncbi:hypothetical protein U91I_01472 [alpha proteobacterium U9-1i]|nr:hypothetical protein U91I_01472 [alpha proteobacterium U9-1i]
MSAERTLAELASDVAAQAGDLMRNEIRLARAEAMENVREMGDGMLRTAFGVALAGSSVTLGLFGGAYLIGLVLPLWAAALIMAVVGGVSSQLILRSGLKALSTEKISLPKTSRQISRDLNLIKENIS